MEQLARETAVFDIHLTNEQLNQFARYQALLLDWNRRLNLTAIREPRQIQRRHFLDALTCATVMEWEDGRSPNESALIDVGSGAGFPGLPLKILYSGSRLTLVESVAKKARFLETVVAELGLSDVTVVAERAEVLGQDPTYRGQYDWATARAVAELRTLVEYLLPFCRLGGRALAQKGKNAVIEAKAATNAIAMLGGSAPELHPIRLPQREELHYLALIEKTAETPAKYPRRAGIPAKRPL
ncbi:MAG: 16S rRNA (guanine(527)-N(7))-methyltransferase RsmG [Chloroflexi bacterium]|nr:16S rRNA (guanine(527)-N(7))-methyltransferase RsmG [Chloroflexota bacterium]